MGRIDQRCQIGSRGFIARGSGLLFHRGNVEILFCRFGFCCGGFVAGVGGAKMVEGESAHAFTLERWGRFSGDDHAVVQGAGLDLIRFYWVLQGSTRFYKVRSESLEAVSRPRATAANERSE